MTEKYGVYYRMISILVDLALVNLAGYFAYLLTFWPEDMVDMHHIGLMKILLINFIWFNVTQMTRLYHNIFAKDAIPTIKQSVISFLLFVLLICCLVYLIPDFSLTSKLILYMILFFLPLFLGGKLCFLLLRRSHRSRLIEYTRVVIVGAGPVGVELSNIMESKVSMGYRVVGFFDDKPGLQVGDVNILGKVSDCISYVKQYGIKEVYCALPDRAIVKINKLMREADMELIRFKLVPDVKNYFKKDVNVSMLGHFPVISPRSEPLENMHNKIMKRAFDVVFSLMIVFIVMSWLVPLLALLIKLESKGPVFFKQWRSGKDNKPFCCWKFRSMRINSDSDRKQAVKHDTRITRIGAFIRKTSLDELPQFFNVLMGEMSVVGPRPHMIQHTNEYSAIIDQFMVRHFVLPGITGWAQVSGHRGETIEDGAMEARVEADIWYMENWSMLLDCKIAFLTVWQVLFSHKNAY
ncbi:putative colanic acid biosynthesis UDP-glucose lipid carrier transferase [Pedobacter sp. UYP24]